MREFQELEVLILETLSFFENMTLEKIILDLDQNKLKQFPDFSKEDLLDLLNKFERERLVKKIQIDQEVMWIKIRKQNNSWFKRFKDFFKFY